MAPPGEDLAANKGRERATGSAASAGEKTDDWAHVAFSRPAPPALIRRARMAREMRLRDLVSGFGEPRSDSAALG